MEQSAEPASRGSAVAAMMASRPAMPAAGLFICGVLLHRALPHVPLLWLALAAFAAGGAMWLHRPRVSSILLAVALLLTATVAAQIFAFQFPRNDISAFAADAPRLAQLELEILTPPRVLTDPFGENRALPPKQIATARVTRLKTWEGWIAATGDVLLQVLQPHPRLQQGQHVQVLGMLQRPAPAMNPGQFDWAGYYRQQRILASLQVPQASNLTIVRSEPISFLARLREHARRLLAAGFPAERALDHALLRALLLGDSDPQLRDVQDQFERTGTSHHLAISGMHVAVLGGFVFLLCRLLCLTPRLTALAVVAFVLLYGAVALPSPPVVRSVLLCLAFGVGLVARRSVDALQLLAACVLAMLIYRPLDLYNAGFQLSFCTVLGLILFTGPMLRFLGGFRDPDVAVATSFQQQQQPTRLTVATNWADGLLVKAFAASVVAWAVSMPLIAWHFEQLNPWAVFAGLLLAPAVFAALVLGFVKVLLTLLWPGLAGTWVTLTTWPVTWMRGVVDWLASWPQSDVPLPPPPVELIIAYYALLLTALLSIRRTGPIWLLRGARVAMMLALLWLPYQTDIARRRPPAEALRVTLLAVGGGQCAVVEPPSGRVVLLDAGSNSLSDLVAKCLGPYLRYRGCTDVDTLIISHANYDHFSAAADVTSAYDVREVLTGAHFARHARGNPAAAGMLRDLDALQRPPRIVAPGQRLPLARDTMLEVLWPLADAPPDLAANDVSLVLRLTHAGRTILFTGDIQDDAMRALLTRPEQLEADVLVAPHHGSSESLTARFVEAVNPSAVVSSNDRTLSRKQVDFESMIGQRPLLRTHKAGAITIEIDADGGVSVQPFVGGDAMPVVLEPETPP